MMIKARPQTLAKLGFFSNFSQINREIEVEIGTDFGMKIDINVDEF